LAFSKQLDEVEEGIGKRTRDWVTFYVPSEGNGLRITHLAFLERGKP
jgi:hypothetical protein